MYSVGGQIIAIQLAVTHQEGPMADDLSDMIEENATGPKRASGDSGSVEQHSLGDQIAADKYLAAKKAAQAKGIGVKLAKICPGGTV
jgi:hypothetical protein